MRFTKPEKWGDAWFASLSTESKLLFMYLCDVCDICGYMELVSGTICTQTGIGPDRLSECFKELGDRLIWDEYGRSLVVRNFIRHQKNLPINEKIGAHKGILKCWSAVYTKFSGWYLDGEKGFIYGNESGIESRNGYVRVREGSPNPPETLTEGFGKGTGRVQEGFGNPTGKGIGKGKGNFGKGGAGEKPFYHEREFFINFVVEHYGDKIENLVEYANNLYDTMIQRNQLPPDETYEEWERITRKDFDARAKSHPKKPEPIKPAAEF